MRNVGIIAAVTASIVLGLMLMFVAFSTAHQTGFGTMMGNDGLMTDECREYLDGHWGMNHEMHDECHEHDEDHEHDENETHEDCYEHSEEHTDHHEMFDECSEHFKAHEDGHHMMHNH
jgi:hypothetical protein